MLEICGNNLFLVNEIIKNTVKSFLLKFLGIFMTSVKLEILPFKLKPISFIGLSE